MTATEEQRRGRGTQAGKAQGEGPGSGGRVNMGGGGGVGGKAFPWRIQEQGTKQFSKPFTKESCGGHT